MSDSDKPDDKPEKRGRGRPPVYGPDDWKRVCELIAEGATLRELDKMDGLPSQTQICQKRLDDSDFADLYARARHIQIDLMESEIMEIADQGEADAYLDDKGNLRTNNDVVQRAKLRVDTRKWMLSKLRPEQYGDRVDVNHGGAVDISDASLDARIAALGSALSESIGQVQTGGAAGSADGESET